MSTRSVLGLIYTLEGIKGCGVAVDPTLKKYGIHLDKISPDAEIERSLELQIYNELSKTFDDPLIGLKIGKGMSLAGYGQLIMMLMSCENAWEAMKTGVRYQQLTYLYGQLGLETGERESSITINPVPLPAPCRRFLIDRDVSGTFQLIDDIQQNIGKDISPLRVEMPYPAPDNIEAYEKRFRCPVIFGKDKVRAFIKTQDLATRFPGANRTAYALYQKQCENIIHSRDDNAEALTKSVKSYLSLFSENMPKAEDAAMTFGVSERTLRRKLSQEGTTFRKLVDDIRSTKARDLLINSQLTIESIARELGYAEAAAFVHAFRRWEDTSPAQYRALNKP